MITDAGLIGIGKSDRSTARHLRSAMKDRDAGSQTLITEGGRGRDWSSDTILPRERSMLTAALPGTLGDFDGMGMHIRATRRTGASQSDMCEVFEHVAICAGSPRADLALKIAGKICADMEETPPSEPREETDR